MAIAFVADVFNDIPKQWKYNKLIRKLSAAIADHDAVLTDGLYKLAAPKMDSEIFDRVLTQAMETDNIGIFYAVFGKRDPNYCFTDLTECGDFSSCLKSPVIHTAILRKKENIALALASNPRLNPALRGFACFSYPGHAGNNAGSAPAEPAVLEMAKDMPRVLEQLQLRVAEWKAAAKKGGPAENPTV